MNNWNFNPLEFINAAQKTWSSMEQQVLASQCRLLQAYLKDKELITRLPHDIERETLKIAGRDSEILYSKNLSSNKYTLYLHGGGFALGSLDSHREMVSYLARSSSTKILSINYRLAPNHPYPAGLEDALSAWDYLTKITSTDKIAIAGDSAGGGLALALVQKLAKDGREIPAAMFLMSPWLDLTASGASFEYNAKTDAIIFKQQVQSFAKLYAKDIALDDARVSPLFGDLSKLPRTLIQVSQHECLLEDSRRLANSMKSAGLEIDLEEIAWQPHVWQLMCGYWPQSELALRRGGKFIQKSLQPNN